MLATVNRSDGSCAAEKSRPTDAYTIKKFK